MTTKEFSNTFDILYNNITSNQAPGLNEYEKSVFLTKAQEELIKNYFNPKGNKYQEGFDDSAKRQIDFSELIKSDLLSFEGTVGTANTGKLKLLSGGQSYYYLIQQQVDLDHTTVVYDAGTITFNMVWTDTIEVIQSTINTAFTGMDSIPTILSITPPTGTIVNMQVPEQLTRIGQGFDSRSKQYVLPKDLIFIVNEVVDTNKGTYQVIPIKFDEYSRLMSKPFKEPLKYQVWRIITNNNDSRSIVEIVPHTGDAILSYKIRYVKRPKPIILTDLSTEYDELTINGLSAITECELNPIIHEEILQRAVELAKGTYLGDVKSSVELGQRSE